MVGRQYPAAKEAASGPPQKIQSLFQSQRPERKTWHGLCYLSKMRARVEVALLGITEDALRGRIRAVMLHAARTYA